MKIRRNASSMATSTSIPLNDSRISSARTRLPHS